ncbi:Rieske (2Fe-2S) protein [Sporolactobacillus pectinivorans]|uniref:Rieske (2Fe-2S) protein n=1 Tax=Sporolactobacillus pectinivorans TaxID=1591408 RepID=UPI000C2688DF|nr:Rieske (2Fe-2S) protein [Sporolactobacillus pectinivorans]
MDRRSFIKELAQSLTETGKEIIYPFFEDDIGKLERAANILNGISWHPLETISSGYQEQFCGGEIICLYLSGNSLTACSKRCPDCCETLQWLAYEQRLACAACGHNYSFLNKEGSLRPDIFSVKKEEESWWVALPDKGVSAHA